MGSNKVPF